VAVAAVGMGDNRANELLPAYTAIAPVGMQLTSGVLIPPALAILLT